eukprot:CAMPEP_0114653362 /NCGR_PEP_ID=MMETSP0191-20121206/9703_1 /TAXON_ID=126664 /ORGANISM="Sorites sp." /LENGTH=831 /DNA_ID=CAMNT_0001868371 /DNA_START=633 /DNA_END=3128 /DNA_ORIENTATION=+
MPEADYECFYLLPKTCERCCNFGFVRTVGRKIAHKVSRDPTEYTLARVAITDKVYKNLHNFTNLKNISNERDVGGPLANAIDACRGCPPEIQTVVFKALALMEQPCVKSACCFYRHGSKHALRIMWNSVGTTRRATQFRPIEGRGSISSRNPPDDPVLPMRDRLRDVWHSSEYWSRHFWRRVGFSPLGRFPVSRVIDGPRDRMVELAGDHDQVGPETIIVVEDLQPAQGVAGGPGETVCETSSQAAVCPGPILRTATIQDRRNISRSTEQRTQVKPDPRFEDGRLLKYHWKSDVAKRHRKFLSTFREKVLTSERIRDAYNDVFGSQQLGEIAEGAFSANQMQQAVETVKLMDSPEEFRVRQGNGKWEVVAKDGKTCRSVVNNHIELFTTVLCFGRVLEHITFHDGAVLNKTSIKNRPRLKAIDELAEQLQEDDSVCWEIDQTNMEAHERNPGSLKEIMLCVQRVVDELCDTFSGQLGWIYKAKVAWDEKNGMRIRMQLCEANVPGNRKPIVLKFKDMYLDSGWLLTSWCNFMNEFAATSACLVQNPEHFFAQNKDGVFRLQDGSFDWTFKPCPMLNDDGEWVQSKKPVKFKCMFEGDDGGGSVSRSCAKSPDHVKRSVEWNMAELGFSAKFKIVTTGRLEFVGMHMKVEQGKVDLTCPITPDIGRYMSKFGANSQKLQPMPEDVRVAVAAARFYSLGIMFAASLPVFRDAFFNRANYLCRWLMENQGTLDYKIEVDLYSDEMKGLGMEVPQKLDLHAVREAAFRQNELVICAFDTSQQLDGIANSIEKPRGNNDGDVEDDTIAKLMIFADDMQRWSGDHAAAFDLLPTCLK